MFNPLLGDDVNVKSVAAGHYFDWKPHPKGRKPLPAAAQVPEKIKNFLRMLILFVKSSSFYHFIK